MDGRGKLLTSTLVWTGKTFEKHIEIRVDGSGKIVEIGKNIRKANDEILDFGAKALLPGFVNAHSHAFHRCMRGRSRIGSSESDSFWKWRNDMYSLVENTNRQQLYERTLATFKEMLSAGITTVGEFHYVHHGNERFDLDQAILDAAKDANIRLVLIETLYCRAGFGSGSEVEEQLANAQKRFVSTIDEFIESVEKLEKHKFQNQTIAIAAHSLRAVSLEDCKKLSEWCNANAKPLHIHVEEQPKEMEDCMKALQMIPSQLILENIDRNVQLTCVHCTFTPSDVMESFAKRNINICICPLTEGYLGDGIPNIVDDSRICLGTDCNNRICMLEEMRWLAYCQHMKRNTRRVCGLSAHKLLSIATENGARCLGLQGVVGRFEVGMQMDFVGFNLNSKIIDGINSDDMLDAIIFSADNADIALTAVNAQVVYARH